MNNKTIGSSTNVKDAMNLIDFEGVSPVFSWRGSIYIIETIGRVTGMLYYTKFLDSGVAEYSVHLPYSFSHTIGYLLEKGNNLRKREAPRITDLSPESYALYYTNNG